MNEYFDIRTLSFSNLLFGYIFGIGLIFYGSKHNRFKGIITIGVGLVLLGTGFLLLSLRAHIPHFFSILIANSTILLALSFVCIGLCRFLRINVNYQLPANGFLLLLLFASFYHYTYIDFDVNTRILIIASIIAILSFAYSYFFIKSNNSETGLASTTIGIIFLVFGIFQILRFAWTTGETQITHFMNASFIHGLSLVSFQMLTLFVAYAVVWVATGLLESELKRQARIDPLTQVFNRRALEEIAKVEISRTTRHGTNLAVIMSDIDHFKSFNDTYGHHVGDKVLKSFASILQMNVREHDIVARYGGEEFVVMLPETDLEQAIIIAEKLRKAVEAHRLSTRKLKRVEITASFGASAIENAEESFDKLIKAADYALYQSKNNGRNCVSGISFDEFKKN